MSWADDHIDRLARGETVRFRPRGGSMRGRIEDGQLVTVDPLGPTDDPPIGTVVLCEVNGRQYLHLVKATRPGRFRFQIGNNHGAVNGWIDRGHIYGFVTHVEP